MLFSAERIFSFMSYKYGNEFELFDRLLKGEYIEKGTYEDWKSFGLYYFVSGDRYSDEEAPNKACTRQGAGSASSSNNLSVAPCG